MGLLYLTLAACVKSSKADTAKKEDAPICYVEDASGGHNLICYGKPIFIPDGKDGKPGSPGLNGANGAKGEKGDPSGQIGPQGPAGPTGPAGERGGPGISGPAGPIGPQGLSGSTGPQGPTGLPGRDGASGRLVTEKLFCQYIWINGPDGLSEIKFFVFFYSDDVRESVLQLNFTGFKDPGTFSNTGMWVKNFDHFDDMPTDVKNFTVSLIGAKARIIYRPTSGSIDFNCSTL